MADSALYLSASPLNWSIAAGLFGSWLSLAYAKLGARRRKNGGSASILVVHASQTGRASDLAEQLRQQIIAGGRECRLIEADELTPERIATAEYLFFVVSTAGCGEAPDNARRFDLYIAREGAALGGKSIAILALGDRRYAKFCAFGRRIEAWARQSGGEFLFPLIEVDDLAASDVAAWNRKLALVGFSGIAVQSDQQQTEWRIAKRIAVAGPAHDRDGALCSDGLYRLEFAPCTGLRPAWEIGDLFELQTPDGHVRDYSVASLPQEGIVALYVRRVVDQGRLGCGSGHLTEAEVGSDSIRGRIRSHRSYRPAVGGGPLLAIGAGSGWGGLRPHVLHALHRSERCHLIFGERVSERESPLLDEIADLHVTGGIEALDLAMSQGGGVGPYVQHVLLDRQTDIREFLGATGRIVLCGRLTMGEQCLTALAKIMGQNWIERATKSGRIRRDFY